MIIKTCFQCKKEYNAERHTRKFCSYKCSGLNQKKKVVSKITLKRMSLGQKKRFQDEEVWNKGKKIPEMSGKNNVAWKGEKVGYRDLHYWVERCLGKPSTCEHCGKKNLGGHLIHWANKNGEYLRKLTDWIRLCAKCHGAYDRSQRLLSLQQRKQSH